MSPAAALGFVLLASSFFAARARRRRKGARCVAAALAGAIAALTLVEVLAGVPLGMSFDGSRRAAASARRACRSPAA